MEENLKARPFAAIVLAAGKGTRMKSKKAKVSHEILGRSLVRWVVDAAREAGAERIVCVVGHQRDQVEALLPDAVIAVEQKNLAGTADAVASARETLADLEGSVIVLSGDCPLIKAETIGELVALREREGAAAALLTMRLDDPFGYGRIVRDASGSVQRIVEQKDATLEEAAISECNAGFYCFDARALFDALERIDSNNAQGEFYLTDTVGIFREDGKRVEALIAQDALECLGVNSRVQLADAAAAMRDRINRAHMENGVTMLDPSSVWIGPDVELASDVELLPNVMLLGATTVGEDSVIGPNARLFDTTVGRNCVIDESVAQQAVIEDDVKVGPRAYLRAGAHLCEGSKAGTHVEIKNSTVGARSKVPHLSYMGDATVGEDVNIGAGSITCNYDGRAKHPTVIGDGAFIGSDTMMVAPVTIGENAVIAAGSCITRDVPADALGVARARQTEIDDWAKKRRGTTST